MMRRPNMLSQSDRSSLGLLGKGLVSGLLALSLLGSCEGKKESKDTKGVGMSHQVGLSGKSLLYYKMNARGFDGLGGLELHLKNAISKIQKSPALGQCLDVEDFDLQTLLPKILKESGINHAKMSPSGAVGYMQLTQRAVDDIVSRYPVLRDIGLDMHDPVDNVILGVLYRNILKNQVSRFMIDHHLSFSESEREFLMNLAYNIGPTRTLRLLKKSGAKDLRSYIIFLVKYIGLSYNPIDTHDATYQFDYVDVLGGQFLPDSATREHKKISEGLRYAHLIDGIARGLSESSDVSILTTLSISPDQTLFSHVKSMRDEKILKDDASISEVCDIILQNNGISGDIPDGTKLIVLKEPLARYLR